MSLRPLLCKYSYYHYYNYEPGDAHHASGHQTFVGVLDSEEGGVRTAITQRHTEPLRAAQRDVHAELTGRFEDSQRQQVSGTNG